MKPIAIDSDALHRAVEQQGQGVRGERSQTTEPEKPLGLKGFRRADYSRGIGVSVTDESQGVNDDDITWKAEEGEGESG